MESSGFFLQSQEISEDFSGLLSHSKESSWIVQGFFRILFPIPINLQGFLKDSHPISGILQGFFRILIPFQGIFMDSSGILQDSFSYSNKSPRIFRNSHPISRYLQPSFRIFFLNPKGLSGILQDSQRSSAHGDEARGHPSPNKRRLDNKRREAASEFHLLVNKFCSILNLFA